MLLDSEAQLDKYRVLLNRMEACALSPSESRDLIHKDLTLEKDTPRA